MTLIVGCGNRTHTTIVSDKRLTASTRVVAEESNKATILVCGDARLAVSYTGVATVGTFRTEEWLLSALVDCGPPEYSLSPLIERFKKKATERFKRLPISRLDRRISFVFAGYSYEFNPPLPCHLLVSNWEIGFSGKRLREPDEAFEAYWYWEKRPGPPYSYAFIEGEVGGVDREAFAALSATAESSAHADALVGRSVKLLRDAARSPKSRGVVGTQAMSVVVPADLTVQPSGQYHTEVNSLTTFFPNVAMAVPQMQVAMMGLELSTGPSPEVPDPPPIAVPKVPRNQPCPCRSGKKYKHCHGRPMPAELPPPGADEPRVGG